MTPDAGRHEDEDAHSLRQAAERFLAAVKGRDEKAFDAFVDASAPLTALLPGAPPVTDASTFRRSQQSWFSGTTGRFDYAIERAEASGNLGFAWVRVTYANADPRGVPFRWTLYLTLVFRHRDGRWFLTHDQNTVVSDSREVTE